MANVKNRKIIQKISAKTLQARKNKNIIAILAIALTAVLFTTIFSIGGNLMKSNAESTMQQVGSRAHAGFKDFTWDEYEQLKTDKKIRDLSYNVRIGYTTNPELNKIQGEVRYFESKNAKDAFSYPTTGTMPKEKNEIAVSTIVLDSLGIPHKLGEKVELTINIHGQDVMDTFTLVGFWEGSKAQFAQEILISRAYMEQVCPIETTPFYDKEDQTNSNGYMNVSFNFAASWDIERQIKELCERVGFDVTEVSYGVNWAYGFSSVDVTSLILLIVLLVVIILSGYLIIYNVFYLNIFSDIQFYGLLKTVGTTGRQLKKIVRRQAWMLCLYGIPVGLLIGWFIGRALSPVVMSILIMDVEAYSTSPWIFIGATIFSVVTVHISCTKPCHMAAKVSPVEAVKYTAKQKSGRSKRTGKATACQMAFANVRRYPKKLILVVLSLGLSLTLLNSVYTIVTGFDMEKYLSIYTVSDYTVMDAALKRWDLNFENVTKEFQHALLEREDVENIGNIYSKRGIYHKLSDMEWQLLQEYIETYKESLSEKRTQEEIKDIKVNKMHRSDVYGVNKEAAAKLQTAEGKIDWEKFNTGNYVIVNSFREDEMVEDNFKNPYLHPGDKVTLELTEEKSKTYEVLAVGALPYAMVSQIYISDLPTAFILPESEYMSQYGETQPMKIIFDAKEGDEKEVTEWLQDYCENVNPELAGTTRDELIAIFDNLRRVYALVGGVLSFILGMIGILNFVNVTVTSILSRKRELAMMEAIGMSPRQQKRMLQMEGVNYAAWSLLATCTLGMALGYIISNLAASQMPIFTWRFTMVPILICAPFLLIIAAVVPVISYKQACKSTVVERLRVEE